MWLVVLLPDGYPGRVPVSDTDLLGVRPRPMGGATVLSMAGIRRLREVAARWGDRVGTPGVRS